MPQIDYGMVIGMIVSGLVSIVGVTAFLKTNMPRINRWTVLAKDAVETIADISAALEPDSVTGKIDLTPEEIAKIKADAIAFKTQLAVILGK